MTGVELIEDADSAPYWRALREGRFESTFCRTCERFTFYPRSLCAHCQSDQVEFRPLQTTGAIYTFTIARVPGGGEFADRVPYVVALVDLDDGVRMMTGIRTQDVESVSIGARVSLVPEADESGRVLPYFQVDGEDVA